MSCELLASTGYELLYLGAGNSKTQPVDAARTRVTANGIGSGAPDDDARAAGPSIPGGHRKMRRSSSRWWIHMVEATLF